MIKGKKKRIQNHLILYSLFDLFCIKKALYSVYTEKYLLFRNYSERNFNRNFLV